MASVGPTGAMAAASFTGVGSGLTSLNATNVSSGALSTDRYSAYTDLGAESKIGVGAAQIAAGDHGHDYSADFVDIAGDTMTGDLTLPGDPTVNLHAATKQYVDTGLGTKANTAHPHAGEDITSGTVADARPVSYTHLTLPTILLV